MKHSIARTCIALLWLMCAASLPASAAEELTWVGCGISKTAFMNEMVKAYEKKTGVVVKLSGGGATKGIRMAAAQTADLGGTCRHWLKGVGSDVHPEEKDAALIQVAWDALVFVAHPDNSVTNIQLEQARNVLDGKITRWSELGGSDERIAVIDREGSDSGVGYMTRMLLFNDPAYEYKARSLKVKSTGPLEERIEELKNAFAIDGISSAKRREIRILSVDGVAPDKGNIASGKYPLYRPLYIAYHNQKASQGARDFVQFVLSDEGQAIISEQGTVNLKEGAALEPKWKETMKRAGFQEGAGRGQ